MAGHILIVDDDVIFRTLAAELLVSQGFDVLDEAADGLAALAAVAGRCPDGILLDISLPGADGFALAPSLAAACPDAKIVLITRVGTILLWQLVTLWRIMRSVSHSRMGEPQ